MSSSPLKPAPAPLPLAGTTDAPAVPAPPSSAGPKARVGHYRDAMPELLTRAVQVCVDAGISKTAVAECLGVQRTHLYEMMDGHRAIRAAHLWALPAPGRRVLAEALAGEGHVVVALPTADELADAWETLGQTQRSASALLEEVMASLRDGMVTRAEGGRLVEAGERVMRVVGSIVALGRRAVESGVQGVPRGLRGVA